MGCLRNPQQSQDNDSHFVEHIEGAAHEQHVEDIGGGGEESGDDTDGQGGVAAGFFKDGSGQDLNLGHEDHEDRQFKDQAESEDKNRDKGDEVADGDNRLELFGLKTQQKIDAKGQGDEIAESRPAVKEEATEQDKPENIGAGKVEGLGQGAPEKVTEHGHDGENGHGQGDGEMGEKRLCHPEKGELLVEMFLDAAQYLAGNAVEAKAAKEQGKPRRQRSPTQVFDDDG